MTLSEYVKKKYGDHMPVPNFGFYVRTSMSSLNGYALASILLELIRAALTALCCEALLQSCVVTYGLLYVK